MNPRIKHLYHQKIIDTLTNSYSSDKLHKILAQYFTSDLDPVKYDNKRKFLEDQLERLDDITIDTIARDHGLNPEIENITLQILLPIQSKTEKNETTNMSEGRVSMTAKQRHDISEKLIATLSSSSHKQVRSLLYGYGLTEGHNDQWGVLEDYIENVLITANDDVIIRMEKDFNLGILNNLTIGITNVAKESENNTDKIVVKKIFISHSSQDKDIVPKLIDYMRAIGVSPRNIFCSSFEGYGIPLGENFLERIKSEITSKTLVIFVLSSNFYDSAVSLCEMGAAWVNTR
jgi:hypothetical protein